MGAEVAFVFVGAVIILGFLALCRPHTAGAEQILQKWVSAEGVQLISCEFAWTKGPFAWTAAGAQQVFRVSVREPGGRIRSGHVCCGGYWSGLGSGEVKVLWDD